jgi:hypothetical protein
MPKWAKEPKEGRILHGGFCLSREELLEFGLRFCAWVRKSRSLPLLESRRRQLAYLIYWRDFILEEGAPHSWTVSFLEKFLAIRIQRYQLQSDHSSRTAIPVEGILI